MCPQASSVGLVLPVSMETDGFAQQQVRVKQFFQFKTNAGFMLCRFDEGILINRKKHSRLYPFRKSYLRTHM